MARNPVVIVSQMASLYDDSIMIFDVRTQNTLASFKSNEANNQASSDKNLIIARNCLDLIGCHYLICSYSNSTILNVWSLSDKNSLHRRIFLPAPASALAVSPNGCFCYVAIDTKLHIWDLSSGILINILKGHFGKISVIRLTNIYILTGGEDGKILIWQFSKVVSPSHPSDEIESSISTRDKPKTIITISTSRIIDIFIQENDNEPFLVSCSESSHTVMIHTLNEGNLVACIDFPQNIFSITMDYMKQFIFCGSVHGEIYLFQNRLFYQPGDNRHIEIAKDEASRFVGHEGVVLSMAIGPFDKFLFTASNDKTLRIWDIKSRTCVKKFYLKGPVTNLIVCPSMPALFVNTANPLIDQSIDLSLQSQIPKSIKKIPRNSSERLPCHLSETEGSISHVAPFITKDFKREIFKMQFSPFKVSDRTSQAKTIDQSICVPRNPSLMDISFLNLDGWSNYRMPDIAFVQDLSLTDFKSSHPNKRETDPEQEAVVNCPEINQSQIETVISNHNVSSNERISDKIAELERINRQLYQFSVQKVFKNIHQL